MTDLAAFIATEQVRLDTVSQPLQPTKLDPVAACAVSVTNGPAT